MRFFATYAACCLIAGILGRNSRIGFWGVFFLSFALSPVLVLVLFILLGGRGTTSLADSSPARSAR